MLPEPRHLDSAFNASLRVDVRFHLARDVTGVHSRRREPALVREASRRLGRTALAALRNEMEGHDDVEELEFPNPRYSLSHCADTALAVADTSASLAGIGVDLEIDRALDPRAARFFLNEGEQLWLQRSDDERRPHELLRMWCVKEAVFKANPDNRGTLLGDYELVEPGACRGQARTREGRRVDYASWLLARTCVAVAICR